MLHSLWHALGRDLMVLLHGLVLCGVVLAFMWWISKRPPTAKKEKFSSQLSKRFKKSRQGK
jgi:hypothetical protein